MANRAFAHPWVNNNVLSEAPDEAFNHFSSITQTGSALQLCTDNDLHQPSNFSALNIPTYKPSLFSNPTPQHLPCDFMLPATDKTSFHAAPSMLFNTPPTLLSPLDNTSNTIDFEDSPHLNNNFSSQEIQRSMSMEDDDDDDEVGLGNIRSMGFPFSLPSQPYMEA